MSASNDHLRRYRQRKREGKMSLPPIELDRSMIDALQEAGHLAEWDENDPRAVAEAVIKLLRIDCGKRRSVERRSAVTSWPRIERGRQMTIAQQLGRVHASLETTTKAREFITLARVIALGRGDHYAAQTVAHDHRVLCGPRIKSILKSRHRVYQMPPDLVDRQKAAASAGGTATSDFSTWGSALAEYNTLAAAFLESLRSYGAFDAMLPRCAASHFERGSVLARRSITGTTVGSRCTETNQPTDVDHDTNRRSESRRDPCDDRRVDEIRQRCCREPVRG